MENENKEQVTEDVQSPQVTQLGTELTVLERLVLLNVLPREGDFTTIKLMRRLRESLSFDEEELKKIELVQDGDQTRWNEEASRSILKPIQIGEKMTDIVHDALKKLNDEKKLTDQHFSLYEKFVVNKKED